MIAARTPTVLDASAITGADLRIHPADLRELQECHRFCWPGNAPRDCWRGTRLVADVGAERLPRKAL